ncbi:hypothetical protein ABDB91_18415 [Desulfoscipio sp. XC116]|uniref:hypothetical protein n=1 Tax=Desulfoscipio sp. XC116 TaxID=3144975 RepID=UPI00325AA5B2
MDNQWLKCVEMAMCMELKKICLISELVQQIPSPARRDAVLRELREEAGEASFWNTIYCCSYDNCAHPPGYAPGCNPGCDPNYGPGYGPGPGCGPGYCPGYAPGCGPGYVPAESYKTKQEEEKKDKKDE